MTTTSARPTVVVLGGGYGGIRVAKALDEHADVVLVDPKEAFQHNVAALRAVAEPAWLPRIFFPYDRLLTHGSFVRDRAVEVDADRVTLASGTVLTPDYLVLATGSGYPFPAKSEHADTAVAVERYQEAHESLARAGRVMLVGAGPVGLEFAGEIAAAWPDKTIVLVDLAGEILPGPYDPRLRAELERQLDALGVQRVLASPLAQPPDTEPGEVKAFTVTTAAGITVSADIWFVCHGVTPVTDYLAGELATARDSHGYVRVTPQLRVAGLDRVYALGDIADIDANKAGAAGRQAEVVAANILAQLAGEDANATHTPGPLSLILPLGPAGGAGQVPGREEILTAGPVSELKGRDMLVDRYAELFHSPQRSVDA